jgi:hypothetical protein
MLKRDIEKRERCRSRADGPYAAGTVKVHGEGGEGVADCPTYLSPIYISTCPPRLHVCNCPAAVP